MLLLLFRENMFLVCNGEFWKVKKQFVGVPKFILIKAQLKVPPNNYLGNCLIEV